MIHISHIWLHKDMDSISTHCPLFFGFYEKQSQSAEIILI